MRATEQCPKCDSGAIWVIDKVQQPDPTSSGEALPLVVMSGKDLSRDRIEAGTFEARVCAQCGFTELYARNFHERLTELAKNGWNGVRLVSRDVSRGPFR